MNSDPKSDTVGLEITTRIIKLIQIVGTIFIWLLNFFGMYSLYLLWNINKSAAYLHSEVQSKLELCWIAIGLILFLRLIQIGINWAILMPLEARIQGINLRDPEVAAEIREASWANLVFEAISFIVIVAVPLLIAQFRFGQFG